MTAPDVAALAAALRNANLTDWTPESDAEAIIAALAAQGWRLTSPEEREAIAHEAQMAIVGAADAAVRAALEGLRAEVEAEYRKPNTWYGRKYGYTDVLAFIDARLAALDA